MKRLGALSMCCLLFVGCGDDDGGDVWFDSSPPMGGSDAGGTWFDSSPMGGADAGIGLPELEGDKFEEVGTNPYTMAAHDPFSTFGADVDTASYDIFVRDVERGQLPNPASVRVEEWINSFDYEYETPELTDAQPFALDMELTENPFGKDIARLRIGMQAKPREAVQKIPANLVFLVDTSGSMSSAEKLPLVQRMLRQALSQLDPNDKVSIVTYAGGTGVALPSTPASDTATILAAIDEFSSGGGTNGEAGINLAYAQAEAGRIQNGFNHVVICTDGDFNVGASSDKALLDLIRSKRDTGVTLTALGFGFGNLNDSMMEKVSNAGNGIYSVVASEEHADRYANEKLLDTAQHIAKDVKLQVEFNPTFVKAYRLIGYENRAIADDRFRDDAEDGGEIGAGHRVTALYDVVLADQTIPDSADAPPVVDGVSVDGLREIAESDLVQVRVRWKRVSATDADPASEVAVSLTDVDLVAAAETSDTTLWASAIASYAEIIKQSPYSDPSTLAAIESIVESQKMLDTERAEFADLLSRSNMLLR